MNLQYNIKVPDIIYHSLTGRQNHLHVHPKFLHSNATSHKWAFGGSFCGFQLSNVLIHFYVGI